MKSIRLGLLAGLVLPLGLATASFAQPAPPPAPPAPAADDGMHHHHDHHGDPAQRRAHMAEHLRTVLQLTSAQDGALNALLDAMKPPTDGDHHGDMDHHGDVDHHDADQHLTTPARLDKMLAHFDEMRAHMVARAAAVKTFYAQLSAPQQLAFDSLAPMMMGRGGHEGRGGGDGRDGMHHHGDGDGRAMGPDGPPPG